MKLRPWLHLWLLSIVAIVCAGFGRPAAEAARSTSLEGVVVTAAQTANAALRPQAPLQWRSREVPPAEDCKACEGDLDDDDDDDDDGEGRRSHVAHEGRAVLRATSPRNPARAVRDESARDPSRLFASTGLPRGPPV